jgi:hypothetical protein
MDEAHSRNRSWRKNVGHLVPSDKHDSCVGWHGNSDIVPEKEHLVVVEDHVEWLKCLWVEFVAILVVG